MPRSSILLPILLGIAAVGYWAARPHDAPRYRLVEPLPWPSAPPDQPFAARRVRVIDGLDALRVALREVRAGDDLVLEPGHYSLGGARLSVPGPVRVRARAPGSVELRLRGEGLHVSAPDWRFEGLLLQGDCARDDDCEHAFHITGEARGFRLRGSVLRGFNAMLKVNGVGGRFPDGGLVIGNQFIGQRARHTARPVTFIDIVGASGWRIEGNLITDFAKAGGDRISYGVFIKGGAEGGVIADNLVMCANRVDASGQRVGVSLGGGGTAPRFRRGRARRESHAGVIRDNWILNCSDVGVYLNRAADAVVRGNLLYLTDGIQARFAETTAKVVSNRLFPPRAPRAEQGARLRARDNGPLPPDALARETRWAHWLRWLP